jgi:hypothetical protein
MDRVLFGNKDETSSPDGPTGHGEAQVLPSEADFSLRPVQLPYCVPMNERPELATRARCL